MCPARPIPSVDGMETNTALTAARPSTEPGAPRPRLPLPVRLVLVVIGMLAAALSPALLPLLVPGLQEGMGSWSMGAQIWVSAGLWALALPVYVLVAWLLTRCVDRRPLREAGWRFDRRTLPMLLLGTVASVGIVLAASAALVPFGHAVPAPQHDVAWWMIVVVTFGRAFLLQGIGEELLWRGYALQTMRRHPLRALVVTTLVFGAMHLVSSGGQETLADRFWYLVMPTGFGFLAGVLALRTRSLWAAVGIHGGFHVGGALLDLLGWGSNTAVWWVTIGALYVIVGLVVLARTPRHLLAPGSDVSPFDR